MMTTEYHPVPPVVLAYEGATRPHREPAYFEADPPVVVTTKEIDLASAELGLESWAPAPTTPEPTPYPVHVVSMYTWMVGQPQHARGLFVYYGPQHLVEANARWHGYDLSPYYNRCGVSAMSPADLGKVVWLRSTEVPSGWVGPCLTIDVAAQVDFYARVYETREVAEVADWIRDLVEFKHGSSGWGEMYIGLCPPPPESQAQPYNPEVANKGYEGPDPRLSSPPQEMPTVCQQ